MLATEQLTLRLAQVFQLGEMLGFLDLLILNVRPNNYELSAEVLVRLQEWSSDLSQHTPVPEKSWFDFLDWF